MGWQEGAARAYGGEEGRQRWRRGGGGGVVPGLRLPRACAGLLSLPRCNTAGSSGPASLRQVPPPSTQHVGITADSRAKKRPCGSIPKCPPPPNWRKPPVGGVVVVAPQGAPTAGCTRGPCRTRNATRRRPAQHSTAHRGTGACRVGQVPAPAADIGHVDHHGGRGRGMVACRDPARYSRVRSQTARTMPWTG